MNRYTKTYKQRGVKHKRWDGKQDILEYSREIKDRRNAQRREARLWSNPVAAK